MSTKLSKWDDAVDVVFSLTRVYHRLTSLSDQLHGDRGLSASARSILLLLRQRGGMTASEIARDRVVSRQFIHRVLAPLIDEGKVRQMPNPRSKRSPKLELTAEGHSEANAILEREAPLVELIGTSATIGELRSVQTVLDRIDTVLASAS